MDFPTYQSAINALKAWRIATEHHDYQFPDSRDPAFQKYLTDANSTPQLFEQAVVCLCGWREEREDLYPGMCAVLQVINNRAKAGWHHGNQYENVIAENQFSSMTIPNDPQLDKYPLEIELEFEKLLANVENVYENEIIDKTDGALYYANLAAIEPGGWFAREIVQSPEHPRLSVIGRTTFFK